MADERVRSAIENWAPRFTANGIDPNDFQRVTRQIERWDEWCRSWSECGAIHEQLGEQAEKDACFASAGQHYYQAAMAYHFGKYVFVDYPDELRTAHERTVAAYNKALPYFSPPGERVAIPYEGGGTMYGILRKPWQVAKPPVVLLVPGLDSVKEELHSYGEDLLRRGMAVLAIDGPGQGEMEFEQPMRPDYEVAVRYAIDYLEQRADLDAGRVGLIGVSLGGYYAARAAAHEPRLKGAVGISGAYDLAEHLDHVPALTRATFIFRLKAPDVATARERLRPFTLAGQLGHLHCPLLIIMGRNDRILPAEAGERMLRESEGKAELWMFEDGNHVCNNIPYKYRPQQSDWMRKQLYGITYA